MKTKEFLIFIGIFTIVYIIFFIVYDKLSLAFFKHKVERRAFSLINVQFYHLFAQFYGISGTVNYKVLKNIFLNFKDEQQISLSSAAQMYNILPYEFAVIYLFFEYLNIFSRKSINLRDGIIVPLNTDEFAMINKYKPFFDQHLSLDAISSSLGSVVRRDINYMDQKFMVPGVRCIEDVLYYVGDFSEKA